MMALEYYPTFDGTLSPGAAEDLRFREENELREENARLVARVAVLEAALEEGGDGS